jgi:hypothetical protein
MFGRDRELLFPPRVVAMFISLTNTPQVPRSTGHSDHPAETTVV